MLKLQILGSDGTILDPEYFCALGLSGNDCMAIYRFILMMRLFHEIANREATQDNLTLYIGPRGQEAAEVGSAYALFPQDDILCYARSQAPAFVRGVPTKAMFEYFYFYGNAPPDTIEEFTARHVYPLYTAVGVHLPHTTGIALAHKLKNDKDVVSVAYFGDGATAQGDFYSAANWAAIYQAPALFICEDNQYAISTPNTLQSAVPIYEKALGCGLSVLVADGNDPFAMYSATRMMRRKIIESSRPGMVIAETYRMGPHTNAVGEIITISTEEKIEATRNDPILRITLFLLSPEAKSLLGIEWNEEKDAALRASLEKRLTTEMAAAREASVTMREKGLEIIARNVAINTAPRLREEYIESEPDIPSSVIENVNPRDAVNFAFLDALQQDSEIVCLGQDIGYAGGVMRTTALHRRFVEKLFPELEKYVLHQFMPLKHLFPERILDTPLDESGIAGIGLGLALGGIIPILEVQFSGFVSSMVHHIQEMARYGQRSAGKLGVPIVLRLPFGGGKRIEYHNDCEMPMFANLPGVVIACPSLEPQDWYDMLLAAIASDKLVLFYENLILYREFAKGDLVRRMPWQPIENFGSKIVREGNDVTVVTYGYLVHECLKAAEMVKEQDGIETAIVDLLIISPLNKKPILESFRKTGRLVVVQEEPIPYGIGGEIVASVMEDPEALLYMKAPAKRVGAPQEFCPAPELWRLHTPQVDSIADAIRQTVAYQ